MESESVLSVIVLFNKSIEEVPCIDRLMSWMSLFEEGKSRFNLKMCLIYDNSPVVQDCSSINKNKSFIFIHDSSNGGTRAAYVKAFQMAQNYGFKWILFLDHDTELPVNFFRAADISLVDAPRNRVCAVVPLIFDGEIQVSPTLVSNNGKWRPWSIEQKSESDCNPLTAISSAALVRVESLASVLPIPECFSLDYLDHWLFRAMQGHGEYIAVSTARVAHSLSVQSMHSIDAGRYRSILIAEFNFLKSGRGGCSILRHFVRLFLRAFKLMFTTRRLDLVVACFSAAKNIFQINKSNE